MIHITHTNEELEVQPVVYGVLVFEEASLRKLELLGLLMPRLVLRLALPVIRNFESRIIAQRQYHHQAPQKLALYSKHVTQNTRQYTMASSSTTPQNSICVAVVGVGLVGSEFINQLLSFPKPSPFRIVSLSSSKINFFNPDGLTITPTGWKSDLAGALNKLDFQGLIRELSGLVTPSQKVILVDNTSNEVIARTYPTILKFGIEIITPNKKAYSGDLNLYESILSAGLESGARFLNEATVGAGLPIISTLKDLVATGDKVSSCADFTMIYVLSGYRS